jgi:hypothetical protein
MKDNPEFNIHFVSLVEKHVCMTILVLTVVIGLGMEKAREGEPKITC